jgi:hypothetical protein
LASVTSGDGSEGRFVATTTTSVSAFPAAVAQFIEQGFGFLWAFSGTLEALVVPRVRGHFAAYAFSTPEALAT